MQDLISENDSTMRDYLRILFNRKTTVLATVFLVMMGVGLGLQLKTPTYEAKVKMLILAKKQIDSPYYKDISDFRATEMTLTQSEIVRSNPVLERTVKRLRLNELPQDYEKKFCSPLKALFVDLKTKSGEKNLEKYSQSQREAIRIGEAVSSLKRRIKVEPVRNTDVFTITVADYSPETAAKIANTISRSYCIFDLEQQLAELKQLYGEKHLFVMRLQEDIDKMESSLQGDLLSNIDAIGPASVKIIEQATVPVDPKGLSASMVLAAALFLSLALGIVFAFVFESFDSTFKSPDEVKSFLKYPLLGSVSRRKSLVADALILFKRLINVLLSMLSVLLVLKIVAQGLQLNPDNQIVRALDEASRPLLAPLSNVLSVPAALNAFILLCAALVSNILLSRMLVRVSKAIVKSKILLKKHGGVRSGYVQSYQNLSEQMYLTMKGNGQKSALFACVLPQEGSTSLVANLGICLAEKSGHSVLIVDANLRKPMLHGKFKVDNNQGLAEVLAGAVGLSEAMQSISPNLSILSAGRPVSEPVAVLGSGKMLDLLKEAEKSFEIILLDCANLKHYKDAVALSSYVDGVILLVSEGKTRKEVLKAGIVPLEQNKVNFIGVIMNQRTFAIPKMIYERA